MKFLKRSVVLLFLQTFGLFTAFCQKSTGINNISPSSKAALDIKSSPGAGNQQGLLVPRLRASDTLALKAGIGVADKGLMFYDTLNNYFWFWNSVKWVPLGNSNGFSTSNPSAWLLNGNTLTPSDTADASYKFVGTNNLTPLILGTNGQQRLRISRLGNVAIGMMPVAGVPLSLKSNSVGQVFRIEQSASQNPLVEFRQNALNHARYILYNAAVNPTVVLSADATEVSYINAGNFGIKRTAPANPLEVNGTARFFDPNGAEGSVNIYTTPTSGPRIGFSSQAATLNTYMEVGAYGTTNNIDTKNRDLTIFSTSVPTGMTYKAATGNVGIGTYAPTGKLSILTSGTTSGADALSIMHNYSGTAAKRGVYINLSSDGSGAHYGIYNDVDGLAGDASSLFGVYNNFTPNGTGTAYGSYTYISGVGTGVRYGQYLVLYGAATNPSTLYGVRVSVSNAGTGDSYGLYTSGEDYNYFSGNVGVGKSDPAARFEILNAEITRTVDAKCSAVGSIGQVFNFERTSVPSSANDIFQIVVPAGAPAGFQFFECEVGTDVKFRVDGNGEVFSDGSFNPGGADYAEMVEISKNSEKPEPGDVIVIDPLDNGKMKKSQEANSSHVAGIYSTKPGIIGSEKDWNNSSGNSDDGEVIKMKDREKANEMPLAMLGIVPCKVSAENGPINYGDLLVTSSTPGYAMKADNPKPGTIVGKSLGKLSAGQGTIKVMVTLQ